MPAVHRRPPLGQNFLSSPAFLARIASEVSHAARTADLVIEIGAGPGSLTKYLLEIGKPLAAIEIDPRLVSRLRGLFGEREGIEIIEADILDINFSHLIASHGAPRAVVAGNLPYYITSPILQRACDSAASIATALFLVQKEVAARITALPGSRDFGYLSVLCQSHASAEVLFVVPPGAFRPAPKVTSALVRLDFGPRLEQWGVKDRGAFLDFAKLCFTQKRKTLLNNLQQRFGRKFLEQKIPELPELQLRAEQLRPERLAKLWLDLSRADKAGNLLISG